MGTLESEVVPVDSIGGSTICGVATGSPDGGVAVLRVSGPDALVIVRRLLSGEDLPAPRHCGRRQLRGATTIADEPGEDALVVVMPGPNSFTGEDVVELSIHAGAVNVRQVLSWLLDAGAKAAGAGEFTRRAFANERLSLDQAEAVAAIIGARTELELDRARRLLAGELADQVDLLVEAMFVMRCEMEANLDFPDDVSNEDVSRWEEQLGKWRKQLSRWSESFSRSSERDEDFRLVIAGPPNAGKSSLFNALLGRQRALVSEVAGTTRDYLEAEIWLDGRRVMLVDTAGLHDAGDALEAGGIALGRAQVSRAGAVIWMEAADQVATAQREVELAGFPAARVLLVENKVDLGRMHADGWLAVSVQAQEGLDELVHRVGELASTWYQEEGAEAWIGLRRHGELAREALEAMVQAEVLLRADAGLELVAFELGNAQRRLAEILGRDGLGPVGETVLHAIFSKFCIGK